MKTYLINLDRSKDRLQSMTASLNLLEIDFERVSAVDRDTLSDLLGNKEIDSPSLNYPHSLTKGEIACFLSHKKCWEKLVNSEEDWALILEDNCDFSKVANKYLNNTAWIPKECQIIHLTYSPKWMYFSEHIDLACGNALIHTECSVPVGTSAYVISREAAALALAHSKVISEPVDNFLFGKYSDFPVVVPCWRLRDSIVRRAEVKTLIPGRGKKNNRFEFLALHPGRLYKKFKNHLRQLLIKKCHHKWLT